MFNSLHYTVFLPPALRILGSFQGQTLSIKENALPYFMEIFFVRTYLIKIAIAVIFAVIYSLKQQMAASYWLQ